MDWKQIFDPKHKIVITALLVVMTMLIAPCSIVAQDNPYKIDNDLFDLYQKAYKEKNGPVDILRG